ncbi:MAG: domain S-box protein [Verrucomicrobiota bacterium]|nr:domain S-box protein [Verrucomicrobiota bacterium]
MSLHFRLITLILALFSLLVGGLWLQDRLENDKLVALQKQVQSAMVELASSQVELISQPVRVMNEDYSPWDEMVAFVRNPNPEWWRSNIETGFSTHEVDLIVVLAPNGTLVHSGGVLPDNQAATAHLLETFKGHLPTGMDYMHFYDEFDGGLLEVRLAPIRPSDRTIEVSAPMGWFSNTRIWREVHLKKLGKLMNAEVSLVSTPKKPTDLETVVADLPFRNIRGETLRWLQVEKRDPNLVLARRDARQDMILLAVFSLSVIAVLFFAIRTWVLKPLGLLEASLRLHDASPLAPLIQSPGEFGNLGRMIDAHFRQEDTLRQIYQAFNAIDEAVFIIDASNRRIQHVNHGATRLLGAAPGTLQESGLEKHLAPPPAGITDGTWLRRADGKLVEVEIREQTITGKSAQQLTVVVARDISERRETVQKQLRAQRLESLGTLAGGVAHDINNMLTPIVLMLDDLQQNRQLPDRTVLSTVQSSVRRAANILRQLLTFGRGYEGERTPIDLKQLIEDSNRIVASTFPKSIRVVLDLPAALPSLIGDPTQLHQVFLNLLVNSRDAMPNGGTITIKASTLRLAPADVTVWPGATPGNHVRIDVMDTGTGIPAEVLDKIFDPFFTTKAVDKGTGLGLSSSLGIVRGHGGMIKASSAPGEGACFSLILPYTDQTPVPDAPAESRPTEKKINGRNILVVEDEPTIRNLLQRSLERLSFKVLVAKNGDEGLELFVRHRLETGLVITDLNMPGMHGLTLLREIRQRSPEVPILVMGGRIDDETSTALQQAGVSGTINKPFDYAEIVQAVNRLLG